MSKILPDQESLFQPPGTAVEIHSHSTLVLAPHFDDEAVGCGGLLAQLARAGTEVRVLFLTDGKGGAEEIEDRETYASRRREEAGRAAEVLGLCEAEYLDLPDGSLASRLEEVARGLGDALSRHQPDLLLAPSPLEVSSDHRACFYALHRLISPLRSGDDLLEIADACRLLLYEVNHPGYPDVLVDVTSDLPVVEEAIRCYQSQLERHDYLGAALGLRSFRSLSLPSTVRAAEGYRSLALSDLRRRGLATLIRSLGGVPELVSVDDGPLVSVILRTFNRPDLAREALDSVAASTFRRAEVVLVNDGGAPPEIPGSFPFPVVRVDLPENRGRAAAANAGVEAASGDLLGFLDDDDLLEPEHLSTLVELVSAPGVRVAYTDAAVGIYELADTGGWQQVERKLPYSRAFDPDLLLLDNYIPFNTLLMPRQLVLEAGPLDTSLPFFEDWDFLIRLAALVPFHHLPRVTCEYRQFRQGGLHILGETPGQRGDFLAMKAKVLTRHWQRLEPGALARGVAALRQDTVEAREGRRKASAKLEEARSRWLIQQLESHALRGEVQALEGAISGLTDEKEILDQELQRVYGEERRLARSVEELLKEREVLAARIGQLEQGLLLRTLRKIRG